MLPFASVLLLVMAVVMAVLVALASRALVRGERAAARLTTGAERPTGRRGAMSRWVRLTRAVERRFVVGSALGLQLTISIVVALAALWIFSEVADNVIDRDQLSLFDARVTAGLGPLRSATGLAIANGVSRFGTVPVMTILAALVAGTLQRRNWRAVAVGWSLVLGGGMLVETALKHTFQRSRPAGALESLSGFSYPSGHSMGAMIGYGLLAYLILRRVHRPAGRAAVTASAALIILAVGFSRLVLGVHYFTDVVGGFAAGAVWLALALAAVEAERARYPAREHGGGRTAA